MHRLRLSEFLDKILLLLAMLLFAWVGVNAVIEVRKLDSIAGQGRPLLSELKVNAPLYDAEAPSSPDVTWKSPVQQSRGENWVFDVFTPPVIYYDPQTRELAVTPASAARPDPGANDWAVFNIELLEVRQRPYKLQLVGYAGSEGSYIAYFEASQSGALVYLTEGQEESNLGVRLISFEERRTETRNEDDTPVVQRVGVARLADFEIGKEVTLTNTEQMYFPDLEARVRLQPGGIERFVNIGSSIETQSGDYVIQDLSADPQEAIITKISKDGDRRISRTFTPTATNDPQTRGSSQEKSPPSPFAIRPRIMERTPSR